MYTVYLKGNSNIFTPNFPTWQAANAWGRAYYGIGNFEIILE